MTSIALLILIFFVALTYASVGHGGASGYLAVMALLGAAPASMATSALLLNLIVAGIACVMFWRRGHGVPRLLWLFVAGSVPAAVLGGSLRLPWHVYEGLVAFALLVAALRLWFSTPGDLSQIAHPTPLVATFVGAGIGCFSGMVGIGGGIFLSPLMVLRRWATLPQSAAISAGFIMANSIAGLAGRWMTGQCRIGSLLPSVVAAVIGGTIGSWWGAARLSSQWMRRVLAFVLVIASGRVVLTNG